MSYEIPIVLTKANNIATENHKMEIAFSKPFVAKDMEICVQKCYIYNSVFNVKSGTYTNNQFSYIFPTSSGDQTYVVSIPDGYYSVSDLSDYINYAQKANGNYLLDSTGTEIYYTTLTENRVSYSVTISQTLFPTALPTGYTTPSNFSGFPATSTTPQLIVPATAFATLIGFVAGTYPAVAATSFYSVSGTLVPQIDPTYAYHICTTMCNNQYVNTHSSAIATFTFAGIPLGQQLPIEPNNLSWFPIMDGNYQTMQFYFISQNFAPMLILDTDIILVVLIRKRKLNI